MGTAIFKQWRYRVRPLLTAQLLEQALNGIMDSEGEVVQIFNAGGTYTVVSKEYRIAPNPEAGKI